MKKPKDLRTPFAKYEVLAQISQGGAGYVYAIRDDSGNELAAKILDPAHVNRERMKRFENEYRFCSRSNHENVISVLDYGLTPEGTPFFVMPKFHSSLRACVGKIDNEKATEVFGKILDGVEAAHLNGAVHRDLKPENILVNANLDSVVVADFGIARFVQDELYTAVETQDGSRLANFQYAAPEQRERGSNIDERTDIYALGLILNEIFTGRLAHGTKYNLIAEQNEAFAYLDPIVERMLTQDPGRRYSSIDDLKKDLQRQRAVWVTRQKLSALKNKVVPEGEANTPLLEDPPKIESVDWANGFLTIKLHRNPDPNWQWAFVNMGSHSAVLGRGPETFQFRGSELRVNAEAHEADKVLEHFKNWLPRVNQVYAKKLDQDNEIRRRDELQAIEQERAKIEERLEVLRKLKP